MCVTALYMYMKVGREETGFFERRTGQKEKNCCMK